MYVAGTFFSSIVLVKTLPPIQSNGKIVTTNVLNICGYSLQSVFAVSPGTGHTWQLEHICKTPEDAKKLMQLPWREDQNHISDYFEISQMLGDKAVFWVTMPSPVLVVCRLFDPMQIPIITKPEHLASHPIEMRDLSPSAIIQLTKCYPLQPRS